MTGPHGTRASYQRGCSCLPCSLANATYQAQYRRQQAHGKPALRSLMPATEARKTVNRLLRERYTRGQIARLLGLRFPVLKYDKRTRIQLRTVLRLRYVCRKMNGEGHDQTDGLST